MPNFFSGGPGQTTYRVGGSIFGLGGGGGGGTTGSHALADYLRSLGINVPQGMTARQYGLGQLFSQLIPQLTAPTGLENLYGPEFQGRAVGTTLAQTSAPFAEAGRALTGNYLRTGEGGGGQLMAARRGLATSEGLASSQGVNRLLTGLEGLRGENVMNIENIRRGRQDALSGLLMNLLSAHLQGKGLKAQQQAQTGSAVGGGIGSLLQILTTLLAA